MAGVNKHWQIKSGYPQGETYVVDGEELTLQQLADRLGVKPSEARPRIRFIEGPLTWAAFGLGRAQTVEEWIAQGNTPEVVTDVPRIEHLMTNYGKKK